MSQYNIEMNSYDGIQYNQLYPKTLINNIPDWNSVIYSKDSIDDYKQSVQETISSINTTLNTGVYFKTGGAQTPLFEQRTVNLSSYSVGDTVPILEKVSYGSSNLKLVNYKVYSINGDTISLISPERQSTGWRSGGLFDDSPVYEYLKTHEDDLYDPIKNLLRTKTVYYCFENTRYSFETSSYIFGRENRNFNENYYIDTFSQYIESIPQEENREYYWTMDRKDNAYVYTLLNNQGNISLSWQRAESDDWDVCYYLPIIVLDVNGTFEYYTDGTKVYDHQEYRSDVNIFTDNIGNILSANIELGTYTGTGQSGPTYPNRLVFTFEPKWVCISGSSYSVGEYDDWGGYVIIKGVSSAGVADITWDDNSISWYVDTDYSGDDERQLNALGRTYYYIACY